MFVIVYVCILDLRVWLVIVVGCGRLDFGCGGGLFDYGWCWIV